MIDRWSWPWWTQHCRNRRRRTRSWWRAWQPWSISRFEIKRSQSQMHVKGKCACKSLSLSQVTHRQVEQMLWDLTDSKNKLAYEKGKLQVCFTQTHTFCMCMDLLHTFCTLWHKMMLERSYDEHTHYMSETHTCVCYTGTSAADGCWPEDIESRMYSTLSEQHYTAEHLHTGKHTHIHTHEHTNCFTSSVLLRWVKLNW